MHNSNYYEGRTNMTKYNGECFCRAVQVEVIGEPAVMALCHCKLCRGWSAAPVTGLMHPFPNQD